MKKDRYCKYCKIIFKNIEGKIFSNHVKWCDKNSDIDYDTFIQNLKNGKKNRINKKLGELKKFKVNCNRCNKEFYVTEREKQFPLKERYYCSRHCANTKPMTNEQKEKISNSAKTSEKVKIEAQKRRKYKERICLECGKIFYNHNKCSFCNVECKKKFTIKNKTHFQIKNENYYVYRRKCNFLFALNCFPDEFDFSLINKFGWYKPKNKGNNLGGVSRDHMISVKYGYENNISPKIISHPANCKLMVHNDNIRKYISNDFNMEMLQRRIDDWNIKYKDIMKEKYSWLM